MEFRGLPARTGIGYRARKGDKRIVDGLIIKEKWLELILAGKKTWEIRGSRTKKRGTIYLIKSGSGQIVGQVDLIGCMELANEQYERNSSRHCIGTGFSRLPYKKPYAWILDNAIRYKKPIPYTHPQGAVIWVKGL